MPRCEVLRRCWYGAAVAERGSSLLAGWHGSELLCSAAHEGVGIAERAPNSWGVRKRAGAAYAYTALSVYSAWYCQCWQRRYAVTRGHATSRPDRVSLIRRDTASCTAPHRRLHVLCGALAYSVGSALPYRLTSKTRRGCYQLDLHDSRLLSTQYRARSRAW